MRLLCLLLCLTIPTAVSAQQQVEAHPFIQLKPIDLEPIKKEFPEKFQPDIVTTNSAIKRGGREGNPLFAVNGGRSVRMGWNVALTGGIIALASWAEHKGHRKAARFILFFAAGTRTAAAINNHLVAR